MRRYIPGEDALLGNCVHSVVTHLTSYEYFYTSLFGLCSLECKGGPSPTHGWKAPRTPSNLSEFTNTVASLPELTTSSQFLMPSSWRWRSYAHHLCAFVLPFSYLPYYQASLGCPFHHYHEHRQVRHPATHLQP